MPSTTADTFEFEPRGPSDFWFACVDIEVIKDRTLSTCDKAVYSVICAHVNIQTRSCPLRVKVIAEEANCSIRSVQESLKALVARGVIERAERFEDGAQKASIYRIVGHRAPCYRGAENNGCCKICNNPGAENEGGRKICTPPGAENATPSLRESKIYEKKDTPTGAAPAEMGLEDQGQEMDSRLLPVSEAPSAMRSTAEYLLLKTGRKGLDEEELSALLSLDAHHYPARVQREIDKAVERYGRLGRPLRTLSFCYILSALQHQPSRAPGGGTPPGRKTPKVDYGLDV